MELVSNGSLKFNTREDDSYLKEICKSNRFNIGTIDMSFRALVGTRQMTCVELFAEKRPFKRIARHRQMNNIPTVHLDNELVPNGSLQFNRRT